MNTSNRIRQLAVVIVALLITALATTPAHAESGADLIEEAVEFEVADRTIAGTVIAPAEPDSDLPGVVMVAGSGEGPLQNYYRPMAESFARDGIAVLLYDKRDSSDGYSLFEASATDLAEDALAAAELLRQRPEVDPDQVGLHGHSEGGWMVIEAGARSEEPAFIITSGASAYTPDRTQAWMNSVQLDHAGVTERLWQPFGENMIRIVADADSFRLSGYDPLPELAKLEQPLLGVFAENDTNTPAGESLELFAHTLEGSGHTNYSLQVISGVNHQMEPSSDGFYDGAARTDDSEPDQMGEPDPQYIGVVTSWIHGLSDSAAATHVDSAPPELVESVDLSSVSWYESMLAHLVVVGLSLLLLGFYPSVAVVRRLRGRAALAAPVSARMLALIGMALPPLTFLYLMYLTLTAGTALFGPVILGRPLPWLLLQIAAFSMIVAGGLLLVRWVRTRRETSRASQRRFAALLAGVVLLIPWSLYWGLFTF